jgi:hypothetical protein
MGARGFGCFQSDGAVKCWGTPTGGVTNPPDGTYVAIASACGFCCAIKTDGTVACHERAMLGEGARQVLSVLAPAGL